MNVAYNYIHVPDELPDVPSSTMEVEADNFYMKWVVSQRIGYSYRATFEARVDMDAEIIRRIDGKRIRRRFKRSSYVRHPRDVNERTRSLWFTFIGKVKEMLK